MATAAASDAAVQALQQQQQSEDVVSAAVAPPEAISLQSSGSAGVLRDDATVSQQMKKAFAVSPGNAMDFTFQEEVSDATS